MSDPAFLDRTRDSYDTIADVYTEMFAHELPRRPLDRALLGLFAELAPAGPIVDVGCGPGHTTGYLHALGLAVTGVDLSPAMIKQAGTDYPQVPFRIGTMTALDFADHSLAGLNAWFSTIHIPDEHLPGVFAEFHRVLRPGAPLMLAFQTGDEHAHRTELAGLTVDLTFHRRHPATVAGQLAEAGFQLFTTVVQEAVEPQQRAPYAYLILHKARAGTGAG